MRKIVAAVVFACVLAVSLSASAETHRRFRRETLWHLAGVPAYFLIGINIHEGLGHGLPVAFSPEMEVASYRPYPHVIRTEDGTNDFVMGATYVQWSECDPPSDAAIAYTFLSPYVTDIAMFVATDLVLSLGAVSPRSQLGTMLFMVGMVGTGVDFFFNLLGSMTPGNDMYEAAMLIGIHPAALMAIGTVLASVALWRIFRIGFEVFTEPVDGPRRQRCRRTVCHRRVNVTVSPYMGDGSGGIAVGGTM